VAVGVYRAVLECCRVRTRTQCEFGLTSYVKTVSRTILYYVPVWCSWGGVSKACGTTLERNIESYDLQFSRKK
jgi:hypothetical protein